MSYYVYSYRAIPVAFVLGVVCEMGRHRESYLSQDEESQAVKHALSQGYRWIRTDGEYAIFEKRTTKITPVEAR